MTATQGIILLKGNTLDSSLLNPLIFGANILVVEQYDGVLKYYSDGALISSTSASGVQLAKLYGSLWVNSTAYYLNGKQIGFVEPATFIFDKSGSTHRAWYGANSTLAYSSTNASYVIQSAINALGTAGGKIFINKQTYLISSTINTKSFVEIYGEGIDKTIFERTGDFPLFDYREKVGQNANQEKCVLADLSISGKWNSGWTSPLVRISQLKDSLFRNIHIKNFKGIAFDVTGVSSYMSFWNKWENIFVGNDWAEGGTGTIFNLDQYTADSWIDTVYGSGRAKYGIFANGAITWTVRNFWVTEVENYIYLKSDTELRGWLFENIILDWAETAATGHAIVLNVTSADILNVRFREIRYIGSWTSFDLVRFNIASGRTIKEVNFETLTGYPTRSNCFIFNMQGAGSISSLEIEKNFVGGTTNRYNNIPLTCISSDPYYGNPELSEIPTMYTVFSDGTNIYARANFAGGTDYSGTDATSIIQSALNGLTSGRTWKEKVVVKGNYLGLDQITIPSYTVLEVQGKLKAKAFTSAKSFIVSSSTTYVEIIGGEIDGSGDLQSYDTNSILFSSVTYGRIYGVIVGGARRITAEGENIKLSSCKFVHVTNCVTYVYAEKGYDQIKLIGSGCENNVIANNLCDGTNRQCSNAIQIATGGSYNLVEGNVVVSGDRGLKVHSGTYNLLRGNVVRAVSGYTIYGGLDIIDSGSNNVYEGNYVYGASDGGIFVRGSGSANNNIFCNNYIYLRNSGTNYGADLESNSVGTRITGNIFFGGAGTDTGIRVQSGATNTYIEGNDISDATIETKITDAGTNTIIKRNRGYVTENSGTATIANNEWVPHGLAGTPTVVTVTTRTATYGTPAVPVIVGWIGQNSTHFQVSAYWTNGTAITADAINISWDAEYKP